MTRSLIPVFVVCTIGGIFSSACALPEQLKTDAKALAKEAATEASKAALEVVKKEKDEFLIKRIEELQNKAEKAEGFEKYSTEGLIGLLTAIVGFAELRKRKRDKALAEKSNA